MEDILDVYKRPYDEKNPWVCFDESCKQFEPSEAKRILDKLEFHYTPKHGSWLNMAEIELSVLNRQCLNRRLPDSYTLKLEIAAWEEDRNQKSRSVNWRFTTADARIKLKRLYPSIQT